MLHRTSLTAHAKRRSLRGMDLDELLPKSPGDPLAALVRQDIDRLSAYELHARIAALEGEIARFRGRLASAVNHPATAA